jgi:DNA-binding transcriptional ArsR family regulator
LTPEIGRGGRNGPPFLELPLKEPDVLADPARRAILARLAAGEATVKELSEPFAMSGPAVSMHLRVLEHAGLIARGRDRREER